jgi:hypothetical protein
METPEDPCLRFEVVVESVVESVVLRQMHYGGREIP